MKKDPIGYDDGINLSLFVYNDPVNVRDYYGLFGDKWCSLADKDILDASTEKFVGKSWVKNNALYEKWYVRYWEWKGYINYDKCVEKMIYNQVDRGSAIQEIQGKMLGAGIGASIGIYVGQAGWISGPWAPAVIVGSAMVGAGIGHMVDNYYTPTDPRKICAQGIYICTMVTCYDYIEITNPD